MENKISIFIFAMGAMYLCYQLNLTIKKYVSHLRIYLSVRKYKKQREALK